MILDVKGLAPKLRDFFLLQGYTWKVNGRDIVPDEQDFRETLDKAKELLYDEPVPSQLEIGRLIIRRWAEKKFDVYLQIGEYND